MYSFKVKIYLLYSEREHMTNDLKKKTLLEGTAPVNEN